MNWPWQRPPAPTVDPAELVRAAVREATAPLLASQAELQRQLLALAPGPPAPTLQGPPPHPAYALDHPFWYVTPQAPQSRRGTLLNTDTLRRLADTYDVLRSCIDHLKREVAAVPLQIVAKDDSDKSEWTKKRVAEASAFFEMEGGLGDPGEWRETFEARAIEDIQVIGAVAVFLESTLGGQVRSAVLLDAATIRPRVDAYGWPPAHEAAYEQWVEGLVVASFRREELLYQGLRPVTHNPYFRSPVEYLVLVIESALRADDWNRAWLTDGTTVDDLIALPENWSPTQISQWAEYWDALLAGDTKQRRKTKFIPAGSQKVSSHSRHEQDFQEFELWLLRRTCAMMGVQPASIGFAGEQYKVSQEASIETTSAFGAGPLLRWRKALYDYLLRRNGFDDLEARNVVSGEDRALERAQRNQILVTSGIKTINEARAEEGLDPLPDADVLLINGRPLEQVVAPPEPPIAPEAAPKEMTDGA